MSKRTGPAFRIRLPRGKLRHGRHAFGRASRREESCRACGETMTASRFPIAAALAERSPVCPVRSHRRVGRALSRGPAGAHPGPGTRRLSRLANHGCSQASRGQLGCIHRDTARVAVPSPSGRLWNARSGRSANLEGRRHPDAASDRLSHARAVAGAGENHLDGWPSASLRGRCRTPGKDFRPESGKAISSPSSPPISRRAMFAAMAFRAAIAPRWWSTGFATAIF